MSSDKQILRIEQRKLINYYEHHVSGVQLVEVDRELDPKRWRVFYGVYRVRQGLDTWDMEKKVFQGQALAEDDESSFPQFSKPPFLPKISKNEVAKITPNISPSKLSAKYITP